MLNSETIILAPSPGGQPTPAGGIATGGEDRRGATVARFHGLLRSAN